MHASRKYLVLLVNIAGTPSLKNVYKSQEGHACTEFSVYLKGLNDNFFSVS